MKSKKKKIKLPKPNQLDDMKAWNTFYQTNGKLPYKEIFCGNCKVTKIPMSRASLVKDMTIGGLKFEDALSIVYCKQCRKFEKMNQKALDKKAKIESGEEEAPKVTKFLTREEIEERSEKARSELPKININRPITVLNLVKNKGACEDETRSSCVRPDIFLVSRNCDLCHLNKWCICPIKTFSKSYRLP